MTGQQGEWMARADVVSGPLVTGAAGALRTSEPGLLLQSVTVPRSGPAEPVDRYHRDDLAAHLARLGPRPRGDAALVGAIEEAGLTGHGGGHVPTALRWRSVLGSTGPLTVVANGAESEPLSAKDATLLRQRPHLVLDGLALASEALGARRAVVWLHGDSAGVRRSLREALAERAGAGLAGPAIEVVSGPAHYLAGESTAIVHALGGGPTLPTSRRPARSIPGEPRRTSLVQNVETLARVALIARGLGDPAVSLLTVLGPQGRHVLQAPPSASFTDVLRASRAAPDGAPQAVLLGGFGGMWARWTEIEHLAANEPAARAVGLSLGAGLVAPLPAWACGVTETAVVAAYLAGMSARQCGPCLFGLPAAAHSLFTLAAGSARRGERSRLVQDLDAVAGRGACRHPDGAIRMIASALAVFADDVADHAGGRPCPGSRHLVLPVPAVEARGSLGESS